MGDEVRDEARFAGESADPPPDDRLEDFLAELASAREAAEVGRRLTAAFVRAAGAECALLYVLEAGEQALRLTAATPPASDEAAEADAPAARIARDDAHPLFVSALSLFAFASGDAAAQLGPGRWVVIPLPQPLLSWSSAPVSLEEARRRAGGGWEPVTMPHGERRRRVGLAPLGVVALRLGADSATAQDVVGALLPMASLAGPILSRCLAVDQYRETAERLERQRERARIAEREATRERDRLDLILDYVGEPIVATDASAAIVQANRQAQRLLPDEAVHGDDDVAARARNLAAFTEFIASFTSAGEATRRARLTFEHPGSGNPLPLEVVAGVVAGSAGESPVVVSVLHDLTTQAENERLYEELKQFSAVLETRVRAATADLAEQNVQLQWQSQELERANRMKTEFLASMSHELRTPINALIGYTALLRDRVYGELTPKQDDGLRRIHVSAEHLLALINDILDLARIEAGRMPVHLERVQLAPLLREAVQVAEYAARAKGLEFALELPPEPVAINTDPEKLKQVLGNLLANAVKFTAQGRIEVRAARDGGRVRIDVADTGIGIRAEDQQVIWEDFRQLDQSRTREYGGTGLGLSIVRKIAERLDATVSLSSELGVGSVFSVSVPANDA